MQDHTSSYRSVATNLSIMTQKKQDKENQPWKEKKIVDSRLHDLEYRVAALESYVMSLVAQIAELRMQADPNDI